MLKIRYLYNLSNYLKYTFYYNITKEMPKLHQKEYVDIPFLM